MADGLMVHGIFSESEFGKIPVRLQRPKKVVGDRKTAIELAGAAKPNFLIGKHLIPPPAHRSVENGREVPRTPKDDRRRGRPAAPGDLKSTGPQDENKIENLSAKELLKRHIKRAKRVRARFREERLQRIARYKSRLALLLPPVMEQCVNDTSTGT
ncbi:LOW QUALITY PROTEIN: hypothetical protein Cgig2_032827 [Carnegiea gigantea]|uniref:Uncharacterized protein n=1 Tax=Carnegiea gigantea TaxID=171969 RepID=A0A9Q1JID3_9CARY|nr:LOW QUALITY PROTEIN: hypothetical protein Cgig2_032827 [Carnegiea gigantea]